MLHLIILAKDKKMHEKTVKVCILVVVTDTMYTLLILEEQQLLGFVDMSYAVYVGLCLL